MKEMISNCIKSVRAKFFLKSLPKHITVFGSAKKHFENNHVFGKCAYDLGRVLAKSKYAVMTGGGPGLMAKTNQGAYEVQPSRSLGCSLQTLSEKPNKYMSKSMATGCLALRKKILVSDALAYVVLPGGYGTLDELFEVLTLIKINFIKSARPIFLINSEFWQPLIQYIEISLKSHGMIDSSEFDMIKIVESGEEVVSFLEKKGLNEQGCN